MKILLHPLLLSLLALPAAGCIQRTMNITSTPSGALVYLNGQEVGRTPLTRNFLWYGNYDVTVSKPGYEALKTTQFVQPPLYQIVPLDMFAEILPFGFKDEKHYSYTLAPLPATELSNGTTLMQRALEMKADLEGSPTPTRNKPTLKPTTRATQKNRK